MAHAHFDHAFRPGARFAARGVSYVMEVASVGEVATGGALAIFDPVPDELGDAARPAFERRVPPGRFRVEAAFARNERHPESRVLAALRVVIAEAPAERVEPAKIEGDDTTWPWGQDPCVPVRRCVAVGGDNRDLWCDPIDEPWAQLRTDQGAEAIVFDVGESDLSAYWGSSAEGEISALFVDTGLLMRAVSRDIPFFLPPSPGDLKRANAELAHAGVRAQLEGTNVLRLDGDVRRVWAALLHDAKGMQIGTSVAPHLSGKHATFAQRYDMSSWRRAGATRFCIRMVCPDEPLEPLPSDVQRG